LPRDPPRAIVPDREDRSWHINLLKNRLVHQSGVMFQVVGDEFLIGPLAPRYPAAKLIRLHDEARFLHANLVQRWTATALRSLSDRLHVLTMAGGRSELTLQRALDADRNLLHCSIAGVVLREAEVVEIFSDCMALGILRPARTEAKFESCELCQNASSVTADARWTADQQTRRARIAWFQPIHGLNAFAVNFDGLDQLLSRASEASRGPAGSEATARKRANLQFL